MLYTAGLIVSHLQLLFLAVVVLTNHNKPRWMTCDPTWRACGEYITPLFLFKSANLSIICMVLYTFCLKSTCSHDQSRTMMLFH